MKLSEMLAYTTDTVMGAPKSIKHIKEETKMGVIEVIQANRVKYFKCISDWGKEDLIAVRSYYKGYSRADALWVVINTSKGNTSLLSERFIEVTYAEYIKNTKDAQNIKEETMMEKVSSFNKQVDELSESLTRVTHTESLKPWTIYTILDSRATGTLHRIVAFNKNTQKFEHPSYDGVPLKQLIYNDYVKVFEGAFVDGVVITGKLATNSSFDDVKVTYKSCKETIGKVDIIDLSYKDTLEKVSQVTKEYYEQMLESNMSPRVHVLGSEQGVETTNEFSSNTYNSHDAILKDYQAVISEISEASRQINQNTKMEDIADLQEVFISTRNKLEELSKSTQSRASSIFDRFRSVPLIGKAISNTKELKQKTDSVQESIDAMFITINKQYQRLIEIGEGLQKAKNKQETQISRLESLIAASDGILGVYTKQSDVPIRELSANNQIKSSYERLKKRILKTEAAIMGTQASIISLGKNLPTTKAEMTEELALSGLLNSVTDYQEMYTSVTSLLNDVVTATSEKTYKVVENLMDLQINDTHTIAYLTKDSEKAKEFATMLTSKATALADKTRKDAVLINEIAKGSSIALAREKIVTLGYNG